MNTRLKIQYPELDNWGDSQLLREILKELADINDKLSNQSVSTVFIEAQPTKPVKKKLS